MCGSQVTVTNHVFATLTYKREYGLVECWNRITKDFNRFITYQRRLHRNGLEYIRSVEAHDDLYPHIHVVIQHKHGILVRNRRYFDQNLYQKWKQSWQCGLSDFQAPYSGSKHPTFYIIKYIAKQASLKTLWKKYYSTRSIKDTSAPNVVQNSASTKKPSLASTNTEILNPSLFFCKQFKIKQVTWSRGYEFPRFESMSSPLGDGRGQSLLITQCKEPCLNRA